jgi:hypothetical protein
MAFRGLLSGGRLAHHRSEGKQHVKWVKRIVVGLAVVFALFYLITRPEAAADAVQGAFAAVFAGAEAVGRFFTSLAS